MVDARTETCPFASLDYGVGSQLATRHLIDLGARRIAFISGPEDGPVTTERMSGYLAVMAEEGLEPTAFFGRPSRAFGRDTALRLARSRPDLEAALCFSDLVALGMLAGLAEARVSVGADFRLVGFDDIEECALSWPQLSSVRCDVARFGRRSAEAMLAWLENGEQLPESHLAPVELIARHSSLGLWSRPRPTQGRAGPSQASAAGAYDSSVLHRSTVPSMPRARHVPLNPEHHGTLARRRRRRVVTDRPVHALDCLVVSEAQFQLGFRLRFRHLGSFPGKDAAAVGAVPCPSTGARP
jgi:hypothetical protein